MFTEIPVAVYRGGTSRALFLHLADLPASVEEQDRLVLDIFGSGHPLQIDGLGGGNPLTSKCAVIGPPSVDGADVDYTFLYPAVAVRHVDRKGNCGNISSAVGPFAVNEGLVPATGDRTTVTIHNTNTRSLLRATFDTREGRFYPHGDFRMDGVPGTGSRIDLAFIGNPSVPLLPSGSVRDRLKIPGFDRDLEVSIVQAGNLSVFCRMADLGISGPPDAWSADKALWDRMEAVRGAAAVRLGMAADLSEAREKTPAVPKIVAVAPPGDYDDLQSRRQPADGHEVRVLMAAMGVMHRAFAVTATVAAAAAAVLPGSIVQECRRGEGSEIRLGHPSGVLTATAEVVCEADAWQARSVAVHRTARHILQGRALI